MENIHLQCHVAFRSRSQVRNVNSYIYISTTPIATKLGKVVTYCQKITPTKSCDVLFSVHVINVKPYICSSAIPAVTKLNRVVTCRGGNPTSKPFDLLFVESLDTWKNFYLYLHNTYNHQTWQNGNLQSKDPTHEVTWPFNHVVTWQM